MSNIVSRVRSKGCVARRLALITCYVKTNAVLPGGYRLAKAIVLSAKPRERGISSQIALLLSTLTKSINIHFLPPTGSRCSIR